MPEQEQELKQLVAYLCLAQLGLVILGIFALNLQGMNGSVLQLVSQGLAAAGLFFMVGMLEQRRGTGRIAVLAGIARPMPSFAFFLGLLAWNRREVDSW